MAYYKDLREYLKVLEAKGKLLRITRPINKDTELQPLARLQFLGLPEAERKAIIFENVCDGKGRQYEIPVVICALGGSGELYSLGMSCELDEIPGKWTEMQMNPITPVVIDEAPVQAEVHLGQGLLEHGGLEEFPIPISTPGFDPAPFLASACWVSKDPETGRTNVGMYRAHVKSPTRTGISFSTRSQHLARHLAKRREMREPLEAAIVIGGPPSIGYVAMTRIAYGADEFACAGALAGEPVELVKCITVDLEVPAHAEIVIEGTISTDEVEPEGSFGEFTGHMAQREEMPIFSVKCITHRRNPIMQTILSQTTPCESSTIISVGRAGALYKYLKHDCEHHWVREVVVHERTVGGLTAIMVAPAGQNSIWATLDAASQWLADNITISKMIVALDEDIDPRDADAIFWAMTFRTQPHRDCRIDEGPGKTVLDGSLAPPVKGVNRDAEGLKDLVTSRLVINATMKWPYPPLSLPRKEFMLRALEIWQEEGLPPLNLKNPWWGDDLGCWSAAEDEQAYLATRGDYGLVGDILAKQRRIIQ